MNTFVLDQLVTVRLRQWVQCKEHPKHTKSKNKVAQWCAKQAILNNSPTHKMGLINGEWVDLGDSIPDSCKLFAVADDRFKVAIITVSFYKRIN